MELKQKLNNLAEAAKKGCNQSLWEIRSHFLPTIHKISERNWHLISSQESFESSCFKRMDKAIEKFNYLKGPLEPLILREIKKLLWQHIYRYRERRKMIVTMTLSSKGYRGDDRNIEFDIKDDLAVVDDETLTNEKIALLAEGDPRKIAVLKAWSQGFTNDSDIALFLAEQFGGKSDSYRKYINRFRTFCQQALLTNAA